MSARKVRSPACHEGRGTSRIPDPINHKISESVESPTITVQGPTGGEAKSITVPMRCVRSGEQSIIIPVQWAGDQPRTITIANDQRETIAVSAKTVADMKALAVRLLAKSGKKMPLAGE